jgi:16S rRNA (cytidine1402-2'-O)-methyltransferase
MPRLRDGASDERSEARAQPTEPPSRGQPEPVSPGLHLVATPIGNAGDLSFRAVEVLRACDLVACEDTRVTGKLLARHGIAARRFAYHEHNADRVRPVLLEKLRAGARIALVSDAGTPLVSDPGYRLVRAVIEEGLRVTAVPGPSAPVTALVLSGLPPDRFLFAGFLPPKRAARRGELGVLQSLAATLVFFEAPHRLPESLADMEEVLGNRPAAVARELTKMFEEVRRGPLSKLAAHYGQAGPPKGEVVVVVGPASPAAPETAGLDERLRRALAGMSLRDAANAVAEATGLPRRQVYARALELLEETRK